MRRHFPMLWLVALIMLATSSAATTAPDFTLQKIGDGVWVASSNDGGKAFANAGFVVGDNGVVVIDTFQDPEPAKAFRPQRRGCRTAGR